MSASPTELTGIARFTFNEGGFEEFARLSAQCREIVRTRDTGTLQYDIFVTDDRSGCVVIERYRDAAALVEHLANVSHLMAELMATATVSGELIGEPGAELREQLAGSPVQLYATPLLPS